MSNNDSISIRAGAKVVGHVKVGTFIKKVRASKHMLRSPRGCALDIQSLKDAERLGAVRVEICDTESGLTYSASVDLILAKGIRLNRRFGEQIALPLYLWKIEQPRARQLEMTLC